jgi:Response receiver domain
VTAFQEHIDKVVTDFLETAVVVDDDPKPLSRRPAPAFAPPKETASQIRDAEQFRLDASPTAEALEGEAQDHPLDARALMDAFADMGVVCSVITPERGVNIQARFLSATARADLVVLDWEIHRDGGETARSFLKGMLDQDAASPRKRLRFVAIYSGQDNLDEKIEVIRVHLGLPSGAKTSDGMALMHENLRIGAFNKPLGPSGDQGSTSRHVTETDLPRRLVSEFAHLTDGLVPAVTLAALTAIRSDTHRVLLALSAGLDIGYLGHRAVSPFPDDTRDHLVEMVAAEIGSVLSEADVAQWANLTMIDAWLQRARGEQPPLRAGSASEPPYAFTSADIDDILRVGLSDDHLGRHSKPNVLSEKTLKKIRRQAANLFTNHTTVGDRSADEFSMRMAIRTIYSVPKRVLRLGTIVRREDQYLVCVQPRCDSVRLEPAKPRQFPFLPFELALQRDSQYELVVESPDAVGQLVRLRLKMKPYLLLSYPFIGACTGKVEATRRVEDVPGELWEFVDAEGADLTWVAELKPEFAQRVAVSLAAELARVGLSESEQLRLSQP